MEQISIQILQMNDSIAYLLFGSFDRQHIHRVVHVQYIQYNRTDRFADWGYRLQFTSGMICAYMG